MLIDYEFNFLNKQLICSYIDKNGNVKLEHYEWTKPTKFVKTSHDDADKHGKYVTWDGSAVKEVFTKYPNRYPIYDFIDALPEEEQHKLFDYNEPNIFFVDIENEITDKKPQPHLAETAILSISIVNKERVLVMGTKELSQSEINSIENDINIKYGKKFNKEYKFKYILYKNEYELVLNFFRQYVPKMAVLTGWNFKHYDWVFLVNRARIIGVDPTEASFTRKLKEAKINKKWNNGGKFKDNKPDYFEEPMHRLVTDYMELYDKWDTSIKIKESSSLDFVSEKLLGVKKVGYETNLKHLYESNFRDFIFYNAVDSVLVQLIHEKMKYIDIMYGISTLSRIVISGALSTLQVTEGILRRPLREEKNIVLCKNTDVDVDITDDEKSVKGGFVLLPVRGMATWTTCYDFASLYPTTIRQFNISADSYKGQKMKGKNTCKFYGVELNIEPNDIILKTGSVFRNEEGIVKRVMTNIYADRKKYKNEMMKVHEELKEYEDDLKLLKESL